MQKILNIIKRIIPTKIFKALQPAYHYFFSWFSSLVYANPSDDLIVVGVTGTVGKTTSVYLIAKMLQENGYKAGYTSTAMFNDGEKEWLNDKKMTMIGRFFTQKILRKMVKNGCQYAIVETSSEGIRQFRHKFINYDVLVFTGLYPEHIESHGSFEKYREAKESLFEHLNTCKTKYVDEKLKVVKPHSELKKTELTRVKKSIVINGDDENAEFFMKYCCEQRLVITQAEKLRLKTKSNDRIVRYGKIEVDQQGTKFEVENDKIKLKLLGDFNATNAMIAVGVGLVRDLSIKKIKKGLEKINGVPGRLEKIDEGQEFAVIVDYAFEPKAVSKLYDTVNLITHNKVIHVLGSTGGGRDVARRPRLGALAGEKSDYVIITNEDPYDDSPELIIDQVALGAENAGKKVDIDLFKILDRRKAIEKALKLAEKDDIVLVTGKGSEQAICIGNGKMIPWDDRKVVRELLNEL